MSDEHEYFYTELQGAVEKLSEIAPHWSALEQKIADLEKQVQDLTSERNEMADAKAEAEFAREEVQVLVDAVAELMHIYSKVFQSPFLHKGWRLQRLEDQVFDISRRVGSKFTL